MWAVISVLSSMARKSAWTASAGKRVVLDGLEEGHAGAFAFDFQVDDDVVRAAVGDAVR